MLIWNQSINLLPSFYVSFFGPLRAGMKGAHCSRTSPRAAKRSSGQAAKRVLADFLLVPKHNHMTQANDIVYNVSFE